MVLFLKTIFFLLLVCFSQILLAETPTVGLNLTNNSQVNQNIDRNSLQSKITTLSERKGLDETLKSKVLATYQAAQDELNNITNFEARNTQYKEELKQVPELTKKIQKDIEQLSIKSNKLNSEEFKKVPVDELSQRLILEQDKVKKLEERVKKIDNDLALQETRPNAIRQEMLKAKQDLDHAQKAIKELKTDNGEKLETDAQQLLLKTQIDARLAELTMLESENASYSARLTLLKDQLHLLNLQKNTLIPLLSTIEDVLHDLKAQQAIAQQYELNQVEKELAGKPKVIQNIAKENIEYAQQLQALNNKISLREADKAKVDAQLNQIEADFNKAAKKIDLASLSPPLGKLLHEQRRVLLNKDEFIAQSKIINEETVNTDFQQLVIEERSKQLNNIDAYLEQLIADAPSNTDRMILKVELRSRLTEQVELLNKLAIACNNYLHILGDFDFVRQQKRDKAEQFAKYLDENLLWVRSSESLNFNSIKQLFKASQRVLSPSNWQVVAENFFNLPIKQPFFIFLAVFSTVFLILIKKWCVQRLIFIAEHIGKIYSDKFYYTVEVLIYDAILVAPLPLLSAYIGWLLSNNSDDNFTEGLGIGLMRAAIPWFFLQLFYRLFEPEQGLIRKHFLWQEGSVKLIHSQLAWLRFIYIPCALVIKSTLATKLLISVDELGRLALNISALSLIIFLQRLFHTRYGLIQHLILNHPDGWLSKLRYLYFCLSFTPLITIGFGVTGYYLSAIELQQKIMITLFFILLMVIVYEFAIRWLNLVNRQLAIKNLQQRRKQTHVVHSHVAGSEDPILPVEDILDIPTINAQTIKILNLVFYFNLIIGLWLIWKNIFPAFSFLDHITLWQVKTIVNNKEVFQAITLFNMLLAGIYGFMTVVAVRNFSGAMELLLFQRLALSAGSRYAINQLAKYSLVILGFACVANELGFSWSQVQWLVAALSVGLGFGLQEIFANFVSGIILLFERPIRVGDTVTIGDVSGKVSRIHMRATTLVDFDQKELIVPNKTFITSQLVNWSLSDAITRVVINVGIGYGSDIELAHQVMLETVHSIPLVLKDPEPSVLLVAFKDSALEFSIRVFVSETANRMPVTHELHKRLAVALKEQGIEIPVPQRDIHIRSTVDYSVNKIETFMDV